MIHLAGDSTVAPTDNGDSAGHAELPLLGWGDELAAFLAEPVSNRAFGGATTATFRERGNWKLITDELQPGDTVVFGFGHNDQKEPETLAAEGGYRERLTAFIEEVRAAGAKPVLTTSVERRMFTPEGALRYSHGPYPAEVRRLGHELDVPVIDLNAFTRWLYTWLGEEASAALFVHGAAAERGIEVSADLKKDNTHYTTAGAVAVARFVAEGLHALNGEGSDAVPAGLEMVRK
ncbi:rhamnogalacturonan acetylesterase [Glycomyces algeriensis]|uniref:Rhamnogalacturonan acetylesterase RhgT n=1 Tax=Glycomyces algeriensis TaxID=256037 RepID=A0A9W6LH13_9ACTN|nr:rhamnogalacturonan acetylesterase [Glycomyces algeriensis]MDA1364428.1 rhamnogalacturonan acetylesterase [Glycomyces algeriensis]MDR7350461.1 lysophospholipase L1-like esterase [Glycomyces algeriensis]GLI43168.1 rhamnogalacturonan acetylesterase RhgT [Glycomyces algeriensis]